MKNYLAIYTKKGNIVSEATFDAKNLKHAKQVADFHKRHTPEIAGVVRTKVCRLWSQVN